MKLYGISQIISLSKIIIKNRVVIQKWLHLYKAEVHSKVNDWAKFPSLCMYMYCKERSSVPVRDFCLWNQIQSFRCRLFPLLLNLVSPFPSFSQADSSGRWIQGIPGGHLGYERCAESDVPAGEGRAHTGGKLIQEVSSYRKSAPAAMGGMLLQKVSYSR